MKKKFTGMLLLVLALLASVVPVRAAKLSKGVVTFSYEKDEDTYKKTDVTGDGEKDLVEWTDKNRKQTLTVNGTKIKSWGSKTAAWANIVIINKKGYFAIGTEVSQGKTTWNLYQLVDGKLKNVFNGASQINSKALVKGGFVYTDKAYDMFTPTKVVGKTLYVKMSLGTLGLGQISTDGLKIVLADGKFTLQKTAGKIVKAFIPPVNGSTGKLEASRSFTLYKTAGSAKKAGTLKKGTEFSVEKLSVIKKEIYVLCNTGELRGWVKLNKNSLVKTKAMLIWG